MLLFLFFCPATKEPNPEGSGQDMPVLSSICADRSVSSVFPALQSGSLYAAEICCPADARSIPALLQQI